MKQWQLDAVTLPRFTQRKQTSEKWPSPDLGQNEPGHLNVPKKQSRLKETHQENTKLTEEAPIGQHWSMWALESWYIDILNTNGIRTNAKIK